MMDQEDNGMIQMNSEQARKNEEIAARTSLLGVYPPMGQSDSNNNMSALGTLFGNAATFDELNSNRMGSILPPIDGHKMGSNKGGGQGNSMQLHMMMKMQMKMMQQM